MDEYEMQSFWKCEMKLPSKEEIIKFFNTPCKVDYGNINKSMARILLTPKQKRESKFNF